MDGVVPLVLLGIRTAVKADLKFSTAELVYGTTLHLPGEFFSPSHPSSINDVNDYVSKLKSFMSNMHPAPPRTPSTRSSCQ